MLRSFTVFQDSGLKVNLPACFTVCLNKAEGKVEARVWSPSKVVVPCMVSQLDRGTWVCVEHSLKP